MFRNPLWPNSVAWEKTLGFFTGGMSNCHIHPPLFLSFSPLSPIPPPHSPLQDTSLIQAKGLTLTQSLPLILAWLLRPPISSESAWYLSTGSPPLIKTDIDRRMWISDAIMCLLRITTVFSHSYGTKGDCWETAKVKCHVSFFFFSSIDMGLDVEVVNFRYASAKHLHYTTPLQHTLQCIFIVSYPLKWFWQVLKVKRCHPLLPFLQTKKKRKWA